MATKIINEMGYNMLYFISFHVSDFLKGRCWVQGRPVHIRSRALYLNHTGPARYSAIFSSSSQLSDNC